MLELPKAEKSYWRDESPGSIYPRLDKDLRVDVAVIGGGITGLTSAYLLKQSGFKVAVLEKDTVGSGTSGRTTGKVTAQHDLIYYELKQRFGERTARIYAQANQAAVEQVDKIIRQEKISCDWQRDDNYVFTSDPKKVKQFRQEAQTAAELGLPATFETSLALPFAIKGAVKFAAQGKIHSQKYLLGLAKAVNGGGSYVFEGNRVIGIRDGNPGYVRTRKAAIRAKNIIVATSVPTFPLIARVGYALLEYPTESLAVAGALKKAIKGMYISPDKQHYSIFPTKVDGQPVLLIVGEGGNIPKLRGRSRPRHQRLAAYAQKHFGVASITHRWSDRDYIAYDNIPLIGKLYPWSKHLYVGTAYKKWGLSSGTLAGMILHDLITGQPNKWVDTFNSNRLRPIASIPGVIAKKLSS